MDKPAEVLNARTILEPNFARTLENASRENQGMLLGFHGTSLLVSLRVHAHAHGMTLDGPLEITLTSGVSRDAARFAAAVVERAKGGR